jgi:chromosome segregation ATPase
MIPLDVDAQKTRTLLLYLGLAKHKLDQREHARQKLATQISQLKKISTSSIKKRITELEQDIVEALSREKKIKTAQFTEEEHHKELVKKIDRLEKKLGKFLDSKESRKKRIQELEAKIKQRMASRKEKIDDIKVAIKNLENLYRDAKKDKTVSKMRLKTIQAKIKKLKEKIKAKKL